jgi:MFS family permease
VGVFDAERRALTIGILLAVGAFAIEGMGVVPALPTAVRELGGLGLFGWAFSAFMLAWIVGTIGGGLVADARGPRLPMALGLAGFAAGLLVAASAREMGQFLSGRALQGVGGGAMVSAAYVAIARAYPDALRARMMALTASVWILPAVIGPAASGAVAQWVGWRWVFGGIVPAIAITAAVVLPPLGRFAVRQDVPSTARMVSALRVAVGAALVLASESLYRWVADRTAIAALARWPGDALAAHMSDGAAAVAVDPALAARASDGTAAIDPALAARVLDGAAAMAVDPALAARASDGAAAIDPALAARVLDGAAAMAVDPVALAARVFEGAAAVAAEPAALAAGGSNGVRIDLVAMAAAVGVVIVGLVLAVPALRRLLPSGTFVARPGLPAGLAARGLLAFAFFGTEAFVPLGAGDLRSATPSQAGLALTAGALGWISASWAQDRLEARAGAAGRVARVRAGFLLLSLGIAGMSAALLLPWLPFALVPAAWSVAGAGIGLAYAAGGLVCIAAAPAGQEGEVSGQLQLAEALSTAAGAGLGGALLSGLVRAGQTSRQAHATVFAVTLAAALLGALVASRHESAAAIRAA